jgi:hypothetical protein
MLLQTLLRILPVNLRKGIGALAQRVPRSNRPGKQLTSASGSALRAAQPDRKMLRDDDPQS